MRGRRFLSNTLLAVFLSTTLSVCSTLAQQPTPQVNADQARQLVAKAIEPEGATKLPHFSLEESPNTKFPDFLFLQGLWDDPTGSPVVGSYAVDRSTGDVWSGIVCREYQTPGLRSLQKEIRRSIGLSDSRYRRIKKPGPMCP
jgi:hypothetical protein